MALCLGLAALMGVLLAEIGVRAFSSVGFHRQLKLLKALLPTFQQAQDDDARQALLLHSGFATLKFSVLLLFLIATMALVATLPLWVLVWSAQQQTIYWIVCSLIATLWWYARPDSLSTLKRSRAQSVTPPVKSASTYGLLDRVLHWLVLKPSVVRQLTFDLECQYALPKRTAVEKGEKKDADPADGAVYVCGLARSGTTILLRILDEIEVFRSLTYRDMPFVLAPNLWRLIAQHSQLGAVAAERAHGDGIHIDFDSPESFEEVFWRTFGKRTPNQNCFGVEEPTFSALEAFANYRALVANSTRQPALPQGGLRRYLSKNNNNLLRLRSLSKDPTATILLVYRNPLDTARSLHRLHMSFCTTQATDPFSQTYMTWLGHHEFGLAHLPFCFARAAMDASLKPSDLNYWLDYWTVVHQHILTQTEVRLHMINHDAMRATPEATLSAIFSVLGIDVDAATLAQKIATPSSPPNESGFSTMLIERARAIHKALLANNKNLHIETLHRHSLNET